MCIIFVYLQILCIIFTKGCIKMTKVFIDGSAGTTGLRIYDRLSDRADIELIILDDAVRKDIEARRDAINRADVAFLCLPDAAAIEAVSLINNDNTVVIDTSTAHRTTEGWVYGFAELVGYDKIKGAKRIANPGCHASGYVALIKPLIDKGILNKNSYLSCTSLTGYSGGGKKMIAEYEEQPDILLSAPRMYGLSQTHKHLKEMTVISGLANAPAFMPIVGNFYSGMEVSVPVFAKDLNGSLEDIKKVYAEYYHGPIVNFKDCVDEGGFLSACAYGNTDTMEISVHGNEERIILVSRFNNLGKGASGAAIQNMNIVIGADECAGLEI